MRLPWSIEIYRKFGRHLSLRPFFRLRKALIAERAGTLGFSDAVRLRFRAPVSADVTIRPASNDIFTFNEVFCEQVYGAVPKLAPDVRTVIDLGANIGLASLYFLSRYPASRVLAIEPDAKNYALLCGNLQQPEIGGRCKVLRAAFCGQDRPVTFIPPEQIGHVNQGAIVEDPDPAAMSRAETVNGLGMNSILAHSGFDWIDLLKIDIEGGERHLFDGDVGWLDRVRCMTLEFHDRTREESGFDDIINRHGFVVVEQNHHTVVASRPTKSSDN